MSAIEEQFRRMVFNVIARNQDDHVKNIAFLMDKAGRWSLSPAFDLTYSYNPTGAWTASHQMTINGKRDDFIMEDFKACARAASMKRGRAEAIIEEVRRTVSRRRDFADEAKLPAILRDRIQGVLRLQAFT
jgi:serine/threonine-protein kinase HipA